MKVALDQVNSLTLSQEQVIGLDVDPTLTTQYVFGVEAFSPTMSEIAKLGTDIAEVAKELVGRPYDEVYFTQSDGVNFSEIVIHEPAVLLDSSSLPAPGATTNTITTDIPQVTEQTLVSQQGTETLFLQNNAHLSDTQYRASLINYNQRLEEPQIEPRCASRIDALSYGTFAQAA